MCARCLHFKQVFRKDRVSTWQTHWLKRNVAALRHGLGEEHTYEFVEGVVPCPMFPGV